MSGRWLVWGVVALTVAGCIQGPGTGFATVQGGSVATFLALPAGRLDAAGGWKTSNGYVVFPTNDSLALEAKQVVLLAPATAGTGATGRTFDPAKPPPNYTLCHGGHCHRNDGTLIAYDEVQAELVGGGSASAAAVVVALRPRNADPIRLPLAGSAGLEFGPCDPTCDLPRGKLTRARLELVRLLANGTVASQPGSPALGVGAHHWTLNLPLDTVELAGAIQGVIDRDQAAAFRVSGTLKLSDTLFDGVDWPRLVATDDPIDLAADGATRETLLANMAKTSWVPTFEALAP